MKQYKVQVGEDGRLTSEQILDLIEEREGEVADLDNLKAYFEGKNPTILAKESGQKIAVPYGRTLTLITVGFMYKPGLIRYALPPGDESQKDLMEKLKEAFEANSEEQLNTELGQDQTVYGESYELHYMDEEAVENFARVTPQEIIPVYSYDIKPKLIAAIRFYTIEIDDEDVLKVEVYYTDIVQKYTGDDLGNLDEEIPHPYGTVPIVVFKNNSESIGDIEPITSIIDAYDTLVSAYVDDEEKFAEAVLLMFGRTLSDEDVDKLAELRIIDGLDKEHDEIRYLTKDESQSARKELIELLRQELYRQSFVPDMTDPSVLGQKSGEAFQYLFALFELKAAVKESYFYQGLRQRIQLTTMGVYNPSGEGKETDAIQVEFSRNLPKDSVMWAGIVQVLWGMLPGATLVKLLPFVDDPESVIKEMEGEPTGDGMTADDVKDAYNKDDEAA